MKNSEGVREREKEIKYGREETIIKESYREKMGVVKKDETNENKSESRKEYEREREF